MPPVDDSGCKIPKPSRARAVEKKKENKVRLSSWLPYMEKKKIYFGRWYRFMRPTVNTVYTIEKGGSI